MNWLIAVSLRMRALVITLAVVLIIVGIRKADEIPLDVFPEFAPPKVEIQTEAPGISTEEVESLITVPIENSLNGIPFVKHVRSKSVLGLSSVRLIFNDGTNLITARQLVQERLSQVAPQLPSVANAPVILPPLSSLSRAMKIGMTSETMAQMEMSELATWTIRPRLMAISGVANIAIWGERPKEFQVLADPDRLLTHGITLDELNLAVRKASAIGAGGFIDTPNQRIAIRHAAPVTTIDDLKNAVVTFRNNAPILVGDVADVVIDHPPPIGNAIINDVPGIMLIVEKQPWANTLEVTRNVEKTMADLQPGLGDIKVDTTIFRPATFIERSLTNLRKALFIGCLLVVVVLVFFLYDWRAALISSTAIPLSLMTAVLVLYYQGGTINTMVLAGLVIALGEVVDDAIIDVENILRRLRLNRKLENPENVFKVVLNASIEVRSAVVYASIIVILAFLPVFFLEGLAGAFFRPLAAAYVLAILASLFVALTVTPAMSLILLPKSAQNRTDTFLVRFLKRIYHRFLLIFIDHPRSSLGTALIIFCSIAVTIPQLGEELLPKFKETDFLMHWVEKPGIGIDAMDRITIRVSKELRSVPGVRNFGSHIGRATVADEVVGPNFTELWISIDEDVDHDATVAKVQEVVDGYPGLYRDLLTYLTERIKEVLSGTSATIVIRIYGPNLKELRETAQVVKKTIENVEGITTLKVEPQVLVPQIVIKLRSDATSHYGLTEADLLKATGTLINGTQVGEVFENQKIIPVVVRGIQSVRSDVQSIRDLMIDLPNGGQIRVGDIADVHITPAPNVIKREGASRRIDVSCNVSGRDLSSVATDIEKLVKTKVSFPAGVHPEFLGEYVEAQASRQRLFALSGLAILAILVLLYVDFQSMRIVLMIFLTLPFALIGGVVGAYWAGGVISLGSLVGFVTILGIASRNAIMLISHYQHLQKEEGIPFGRELILRGAEERLVPILMTALTTGLALMPLAISGDLPGHEIEHPMALVILGGLITATCMNLFILPVFYAKIAGRFR